MKEHTFLLLLFGVLAVLIGIIFRAVYRSSISISDDVGVNHPTKKRFFYKRQNQIANFSKPNFQKKYTNTQTF